MAKKNELSVTSIASLLAGDGIQSISKATGVKQEQVASVLSGAIPTLLSGMERNASTKDGADALSKALSQHQGKDTENVSAFLKNVDTEDGKKILGHVLGSNEDAATKALAERSGLSGKDVTKILTMLAPLLLSLLGNKKEEEEAQPQTTQSNGVLSLLGGVLGSGSQQQSSGSGLDGLASAALSILGSGSESSGASQEQSGGLLSGLLNLFH